MPECFTWSQASDKSITGLCSMELQMETVRNMRNGCPVCISPRPLFGVCNGCVEPPPAAYRVTIALDSNGAGAGNPDMGCGAEYNREFICYSSEPCVWESIEREKSCTASVLSPNVTCGNITTSNRARVKLQVFATTIADVLVTRWVVTAAWSIRAGPGFPSWLFSNPCSVTARGHASGLDCYEPVSASYYSRVWSLGDGSAGSGGGNPMLAYDYGGSLVTMSATIRPLS